MKNTGKILIVFLWLFGGTMGMAKAATSTISAAINAGTLSMSAPGTATISAIGLDSVLDTGSATTGTISNVQVRDHRAAAPGWSLTATCSNFIDGGSNTIAVTNLTITPGTITPIGTSSLTSVTAGSAHTYTTTSDPATLMTAAAGNGRGHFNLSPGLSLLINVNVVPATYTATMTETVA